MAYLCVKASTTTQSYSCYSTAEKPYIVVNNSGSKSYVPIRTTSSDVKGLKVKANGSTYVPVKTSSSTTTVSSISSYSRTSSIAYFSSSSTTSSIESMSMRYEITSYRANTTTRKTISGFGYTTSRASSFKNGTNSVYTTNRVSDRITIRDSLSTSISVLLNRTTTVSMTSQVPFVLSRLVASGSLYTYEATRSIMNGQSRSYSNVTEVNLTNSSLVSNSHVTVNNSSTRRTYTICFNNIISSVLHNITISATNSSAWNSISTLTNINSTKIISSSYTSNKKLTITIFGETPYDY